MASYILITEPARGTSVRIEIPMIDGYCDYDRTMREWMQTNDKTAWDNFVAYCDENKTTLEDADCVEFYREESGDDIQIIEETRHDPVVKDERQTWAFKKSDMWFILATLVNHRFTDAADSERAARIISDIKANIED